MHANTAPRTDLPNEARAARWWLALCLLGNGLLQLLDLIRQSESIRAEWPRMIGSGPNAAAVLAIAGALVALAVATPTAAVRRWSIPVRINAALAASALGLLVWEIIQPFTRRGVFDWWDVTTTAVTTALLMLLWPRVSALRGD